MNNNIKELLESFNKFQQMNNYIEQCYNIVNFVSNKEDFEFLKREFYTANNNILFENKIEFGDFQTNRNLSDRICKYIKDEGFEPEIIIEPTSGIGNFIVSSLKTFKNVKRIYGIEINKHYDLSSKFNIIQFIENEKVENSAKIEIFNSNIFDFNFSKLNIGNENVLIIGNPPWVTNANLSILNSRNLPPKSNFKNHNGIDAITGKGNFDISEFITLNLIKYFQNKNAFLSFIVKNSVVKNIIYEQYKNKFNISNIKKLNIDAKREFDVSVDASVLMLELNKLPAFEINEKNIYNDEKGKTLGWQGNSFVSSIEDYKNYSYLDGKSQLEWRSGIKHDCSKILEFKKIDGAYINKLNERFEIEDNLVYGFIKGSFLKNRVIDSSDLYTIVPQKIVAEETKYIEIDFPKTYKYLNEHISYFKNRKSMIYKDKPDFSIFGIGDYSFKPYKIAIASLYKNYKLSLILPAQNNKALMLDDTCFFLSFDNIEYALFTYAILNSDDAINFIDSLAFGDTMRKYNKEVLMRLDLYNLSQRFTLKKVEKKLEELLPDFTHFINEYSWEKYSEFLEPRAFSMTLY